MTTTLNDTLQRKGPSSHSTSADPELGHAPSSGVTRYVMDGPATAAKLTPSRTGVTNPLRDVAVPAYDRRGEWSARVAWAGGWTDSGEGFSGGGGARTKAHGRHDALARARQDLKDGAGRAQSRRRITAKRHYSPHTTTGTQVSTHWHIGTRPRSRLTVDGCVRQNGPRRVALAIREEDRHGKRKLRQRRRAGHCCRDGHCLSIQRVGLCHRLRSQRARGTVSPFDRPA